MSRAPNAASAPALLGLAGIVTHALGAACYGSPIGPDVPHGFLTVLGVFLLSVSVVCAEVSWGHLLFRGRPLWEKFLWGATVTVLLLGTIGFLPVTGAAFSAAWRVFLLAGCAGAFWVSRKEKAGRIPFGRTDLAAAVALALAVIGASSPQLFFDSLWYHLPASRLWFEAGRVHLPERLPIAFQTGLWDYQFLLGQILLGSPGDGGLIAAQLFGQWLSLASAFFTYLLLRTERAELGLTPFAAFVGLAGTELFFEAEIAKNDWAVALWSLAALVFLRQRRFRVAAFAGGLALAMKLSSAFFLLPWAVLLAWTLRRDTFRLFRSAGLFLAGAAPILARNLAFTGNPFFPALASLFPSPLLGPSWQGLSAYSTILQEGNLWVGKLLAIPRANAGLLGLAAAPWARRRLDPRALAPAAVAVASLVLLFFGMGPRAEWRFAGGGLVLAAAYGGLSLELLAASAGRKRAAWLTAALGLLALLWFPVDWKAPARAATDPALRIREWISGGAMAWTRLNAQPGTAATLNETKIYYLFPGFPRRAFDDPALDRRLAEARGPEDLLVIFRGAGVRYLVLSAEFIDRAYNRRVCDWAYELSEKHPEAVVYREELSRVLDLGKLR